MNREKPIPIKLRGKTVQVRSVRMVNKYQTNYNPFTGTLYVNRADRKMVDQVSNHLKGFFHK